MDRARLRQAWTIAEGVKVAQTPAGLSVAWYQAQALHEVEAAETQRRDSADRQEAAWLAKKTPW